MTYHYGCDGCDGCGQPWGKVRAGPVLEDRIWLRIVCRSQDILCDGCVRRGIEQTLGRPLVLTDLKPCPFNWCGISRGVHRGERATRLG